MRAKPHRNSRSRNHAQPFVLVNMAMTADGKTATANRAVSSFGSKRDLEHLYELRATADAVMSGARTIDSNKVLLGPGGEKFRRLRLRHGLAAYNLRIIVSGSGTIDPKAAIFQHRFAPIIVLTTRRASEAKLKRLRALAAEVHICGRREINWPATLRWLQRRWNVRRLLCEGGGELNGALFTAGVVDELHLTVCPTIFGGRPAPTIADGIGARTLAAAREFRLHSSRKIGDELFLTFAKC